MAPNEIGAAAAYEVFRTWTYHYGIVAQPLSGDFERQREAIVGLAVGEGMFTYPFSSSCYDVVRRRSHSIRDISVAIRCLTRVLDS